MNKVNLPVQVQGHSFSIQKTDTSAETSEIIDYVISDVATIYKKQFKFLYSPQPFLTYKMPFDRNTARRASLLRWRRHRVRRQRMRARLQRARGIRAIRIRQVMLFVYLVCLSNANLPNPNIQARLIAYWKARSS